MAAAPAVASVFDRFESRELFACAQMAAIIETKRSHREKKKREDKPSSSTHLSFLANWWALGSRGGLCSQNDGGQKSAQSSN